MLSIRSTALRSVLTRTNAPTFIRTFAAAKPAPTVADDDEDSPRFSPVEVKAGEMKKVDPYMVFGDTEDLPAPVLPDNPAEISALDPAQKRHYNLPDGTERLVHIRQGFSSPMQSPRNKENYWVVSFQDEGETGNTWTNPLMGWVSGMSNDTLVVNMPHGLLLSFLYSLHAIYTSKLQAPIHRLATFIRK